jgi:hypothetical protein
MPTPVFMKSNLRKFVEKYMGEEFGPAVDSPAFPLILVVCLFFFIVSYEVGGLFLDWLFAAGG